VALSHEHEPRRFAALSAAVPRLVAL